MAKQVKDQNINARVSPAEYARVIEYVNASEDMTMGDLIRKGVEEYMLNHPLKAPKSSPTEITKPGQEG